MFHFFKMWMFFKQIPGLGGGGPMENCFPDGSEIYVLVLLRFNKFEFSGEKGVQHSLVHVIVVLNYSFKI